MFFIYDDCICKIFDTIQFGDFHYKEKPMFILVNILKSREWFTGGEIVTSFSSPYPVEVDWHKSSFEDDTTISGEPATQMWLWVKRCES